jgi:hypothetical protein
VAKTTKGTPTHTNLFVLRRWFAGRDEAPATGIPATSYPHLNRCRAAGLFEVDRARSVLVLTEAGRAAIGGAK